MSFEFELLSKEDILIAAFATKRPVAFLVGSPLSVKDGVGVPGVKEILNFVRAEILARDDSSLSRFEAALKDKTGGEAYQQAMKWLGSRMGQDAINDVIKKAVMEARKTIAPELLSGDGEPADWNIPPGTAALGEMVAGGNERFLGPVLTTNFDPLISLAVRTAGGQSGRRVLTADGTLAGSEIDEICNVVHLHGFWRNSDTLHTQTQLTNPRPKLKKSLQRLLQGRTLIVAAYGGWDDVFTHALVDLMNDEQAPLDVIWCFYEESADKVMERHEKLINAVEPAIVMNRFRAFGGIDCHTIFAEILSKLRCMSPSHAVSSSVSPIAGWELIDSAYLDALSPLRSEEVILYFDGATPTWRHAVCADIPNRTVVEEIALRLDEVRKAKGSCSLQLIRAAGGEGKSTILLQAAAAAVRSGEWNVLWRPASRMGLPPEHIGKLDPSKDWLIVADDTENLVRDLREAARHLHEAGNSHVHFLLAARDTDWRYSQGDRQSWGTLLNHHPDILLRELSSSDANMLIGAWQKYGSAGLRELESLNDTTKQVAALLDAVRGAYVARDQGSFFGGLLDVRFGPDGLRSHVVALLTRLKDRRIEHSNHTLFDALIYVAACHAVDIPGLNENILADLVVVSRDWVQTLVVNPLGEEAAAVRSAGHVLTRHNEVAAAIVVAAEQDFRIDIAEIWSAIVRQTVHTSNSVHIGKTFTHIIHAGPKLQCKLPHQFTEQRRKEIAVAAAKSAVEHQSSWLGCLVDLGKTYRNAGDYTAAVQVFRNNLKSLSSKSDFKTVVRGYWYEWGVAEGERCEVQQKALADGWLSGLSLADHLSEAPIRQKDIMFSCTGLGIAFGKLVNSQQDSPFTRVCRAAAYLGRLSTDNDVKALGYFDKFDREADKISTPHPKNIDEAIDWLKSAVAKAGRELQDPFLTSLINPGQVSFNMLHKLLKPDAAPIPIKLEAMPSTKIADSELLLQQQRNNLEERIQAGIERVLSQAWKDVPFDISEEERFRLAKQNASKIIPTLSPHIKRQVSGYFQTQKWEPLKARNPSD
jgi:hypothetical protein